jgi:hypothetical protein
MMMRAGGSVTGEDTLVAMSINANPNHGNPSAPPHPSYPYIGMRYGIGGVVNKINPKDLTVVSNTLYKWSTKWSNVFANGKDAKGNVNGGLQFTFCETGLDLPPWEMPLPWK